ncbi:MAG: hypothetical protein QOK31_20 [Solirubrobacteraceae bacterium]|jgi:hypothetical protein|nr:hypothetical protein [Solirubrobacteraceae bacterium]
MSTDRQLRRDSGRFSRIGLRMLLAGLAVAAIGVILLLVDHHHGTAHGIGLMLTWLGAVPGVVGVALLVIGGAAGWAGRQKPFA